MRNAVSQPGLAFVGWTRATTWARVAFQSLPPLEDFIAVRLQQAFKARAEFEASADKLHDSFLHRRGITEDMQIQAHQKHLQHFLMEREGRPATDSEVGGIAFMLKQCGVAPVSDSVQQAAQKKCGKVSGAGLWHIVHAFRADKAFRRTGQSKGAGAKQSDARPQCLVITEQLLREHGYPEEHIQEALAACGPDLARCVDHCLQQSAGPVCDPRLCQDPQTEDSWCAVLICSMCFDEALTTMVLASVDFSFPQALRILLNGNSDARDLYRFRRHTCKARVIQLNMGKVACASVREEYEKRASDDLLLDLQAIDLGEHAASTTGACFWLCLAAGLSRCGWQLDTQALPGLSGCRQHFADLRSMPLRALDRAPRGDIEHTPLGRFAFGLRQYMCAGPGCVLLRDDMKAKLYTAFAALEPSNGARTLPSYKRWVEKLATREYADELVVLACAAELNIRIVCVPRTPGGLEPK